MATVHRRRFDPHLSASLVSRLLWVQQECICRWLDFGQGSRGRLATVTVEPARSRCSELTDHSSFVGAAPSNTTPGWSALRLLISGVWKNRRGSSASPCPRWQELGLSFRDPSTRPYLHCGSPRASLNPTPNRHPRPGTV